MTAFVYPLEQIMFLGCCLNALKEISMAIIVFCKVNHQCQHQPEPIGPNPHILLMDALDLYCNPGQSSIHMMMWLKEWHCSLGLRTHQRSGSLLITATCSSQSHSLSSIGGLSAWLICLSTTTRSLHSSSNIEKLFSSRDVEYTSHAFWLG
jgi:hypothetical protein